MPMVSAGTILKHILKEKQLSQKEIAKKSDIYPQRINDLIKGKRKFTPELSNRLEQALEIDSLGYFYKIQTNYDIYNYQDEQERKITPDLLKFSKSVLWGTDIGQINWIRSASQIIKRIFEYGNEVEIEEIVKFYGCEKVTEVLNAISKTDTRKLNERNKNREKFEI
jgi:addiction module HigA family antidote